MTEQQKPYHVPHPCAGTTEEEPERPAIRYGERHTEIQPTTDTEEDAIDKEVAEKSVFTVYSLRKHKPCPFCGSKPELAKTAYWALPGCRTKGCFAVIDEDSPKWYISEDCAWAEWDKRA